MDLILRGDPHAVVGNRTDRLPNLCGKSNMNRTTLRRKFDCVVQEINPDLGKKFLTTAISADRCCFDIITGLLIVR